MNLQSHSLFRNLQHGWWLVACLLGIVIASGPRLSAQSVQEVLIVVCQYQDTEVPLISSEEWAEQLNDRVNAFYQSATQGMAPEFDFIAVPDVLEFDFTYESTEETGIGETTEERLVDDPNTLFREGRLALIHARDTFPEKFAETVWLYAIVNRAKRGRAMQESAFHTLDAPGGGLWINAALSVISDPVAELLRDYQPPRLNTQSDDADGDRLSDADEAAVGGDPEDWDTDGDRLSDFVEATLSMTQVFDDDTDGDGLSDWVEYRLGTSNPRVNDRLVLPDETISLVAHELGHNLGLPDLYSDKRYFDEAAYHYWGLMAADNLQNFGGFSRREKRWHEPAFGQRIVTVGPGGVGAQTYTLIEPQRALAAGEMPQDVTEMIRIQRPFYPEVILEARPKLLNDATRSSVGPSRFGEESGLPGGYRSGVLMTEVDARFDESGRDVRYVFGEPISKVIPFLGTRDPSPERSIFASIDGSVDGPGQLVVWAAVGGGESTLQIELDGVNVRTLEDTRNERGLAEFQPVIIPLDSRSYDVSVRHETPYVFNGDVLGRAWISQISLAQAPFVRTEPTSVVGRGGGTVDVPFGFGSWDRENAVVTVQRESGSGVWNDTARPQLVFERVRFLNAQPNDSATYRVQVVDRFGMVTSDPFEVTVLDPVSDALAIHLGVFDVAWTESSLNYPWQLSSGSSEVETPADLPENFPLSLTGRFEGPAVVRFEWSNQGGNFDCFVDEVAEASLSVGFTETRELMIPEGAHLVRWTYSKNPGGGAGIFGSVQVIRTPIVTRSPRRRMVNLGESATLSTGVYPSGRAETTFQWFLNGAPIAGATEDFLTIGSAQESDAGLYSVRIGSLPGLPVRETTPAELRIRPSVGDDLIAGRLNGFGMETWTEEHNFSGWVNDSEFLFSELYSPALATAPIETGEVFADDTGLEVTVGNYDEGNGTYEVTVRSDPPPVFSDLEIAHASLDSVEFNGEGTYLFGTAGEFNDPVLGGDAIYIRRIPFIDFLGPVPFVNFETIPTQHFVSFRVRNAGLGPAEDIRGTIFFLPPYTFIGPLVFDQTSLDRNRLAELAFDQAEVSIAELGVAESTVVTAEIYPEGYFQAVLLLDRVENESSFWNNSYQAVFWVDFTSFGSPYEPVDLDFDFANVNPHRHVMFPRLSGLPPRWNASVTDPTTGLGKLSVSLDPGEADEFLIRIAPPEPEFHKPGTPVQIGVEGWMDWGDSYIPVGEIPVVIVPTHPTLLELNVKPSSVDATLTGQLRYTPLSGDEPAASSEGLAETLVRIDVVGSDGSFQERAVTTGNQGGFSASVDATEGVKYVAQAHYAGSAAYHPAESKTLEWGELVEAPIQRLTLSRAAVVENSPPGTPIGEFKAEGGKGPFEFSLTAGAGGQDNEFFNIEGGRLILKSEPDHEALPVARIRVQVADVNSSARLTRTFSISIEDRDNEDTDGDGLSEKLEDELGTSDLRIDSDGDGYSDRFEVGAGFSAADPDESPVTYWKETRRIEFENPVAARWSDLDEAIYVGRRNVEAQDGLYRIRKDDSVSHIAAGDRVAGVLVVPEERAIFFSEDFAGEINRVEMVLRGRDPLPANAARRWIADFHAGDDDPVGMAWVPRDGQKRSIAGGNVVVVDRGANGPDEIWRFDPRRVGSESVVHRDNDTLRDAVDVAVGRDRIYVVDADAPVSRLRLFSLGGRGSLASVPHFALEGVAKGIVVDPVNQEILMMMDEGERSRIHRLNPVTGVRRVELGGFSGNPGWSCLSLSDDGATLVVTDHTDDTIGVYQRRYLRPPSIDLIEPLIAQPGGSIVVKGEGLSELTGVWIGTEPQVFREGKKADEFFIQLGEDTAGGRLRVQTLAGEVESNTAIYVPKAPSSIELSEHVVSVNQAVGAVLARLSATDSDPGDSMRFELLPFMAFPDNRYYAISGDYLSLARPIVPNLSYQHRIAVRATDRFGLSVVEEFMINLASLPEIVQHPESAIAGSGETVRFEVVAEGSPQLSYQWFHNESPLDGATTSALIIPNIDANRAGRYSVMIQNAYGEIVSHAVELTLRSRLDAVRIHSIEINGDGTVQLELEVSGEGTHRIGLEWSRDLENWTALEEREVAAGIVPWVFSLLEETSNASFRFVAIP